MLLEPEDGNIMENANVLSIVLEIEASRLGLGIADLLAVAAQTMTRDEEGAPWWRLDRIGRPEITNVSPENQPIREARWLEQNWSPHERFWFHHATQGTSSEMPLRATA